VGHPLIERLSEIRPGPDERKEPPASPLKLLVLPGSRHSEVSRLMEPFGEALTVLKARFPQPFDVTIPAVPHLVEEIERRAEAWSVKPRIVKGETAKWAAFREADVALAASGTVTLELGLSGVPMVVAYRVSKIEELLKYLIKAPSIVLSNLVLGENVIPELIQWDCTPDKLCDALLPLFSDTPERRKQIEAFARMDGLMRIGDELPSERAARVVEEVLSSSPRHSGAVRSTEPNPQGHAKRETQSR
jgi:lipid-A-disaccharide synthase